MTYLPFAAACLRGKHYSGINPDWMGCNVGDPSIAYLALHEKDTKFLLKLKFFEELKNKFESSYSELGFKKSFGFVGEDGYEFQIDFIFDPGRPGDALHPRTGPSISCVTHVFGPPEPWADNFPPYGHREAAQPFLKWLYRELGYDFE